MDSPDRAAASWLLGIAPERLDVVDDPVPVRRPVAVFEACGRRDDLAATASVEVDHLDRLDGCRRRAGFDDMVERDLRPIGREERLYVELVGDPVEVGAVWPDHPDRALVVVFGLKRVDGLLLRTLERDPLVG